MTHLTRSTLLAGFSAIAFAAPVAAQETTARGQSVATAVQPDPNSTIIVTGTRRTDRTVEDSPVPIDVIGGEALINTGLTETNKILNQLVPSFNFPQPSIADGTDVLRPATLRGLSPDQTLVLVNGKRRHVSALLNINGTIGRGSAAVDLNLIPTLAIERIEVLRDGASSQYGSDAIAGVINIQLKKASRGGRAVASYGKYYSTLPDTFDLDSLQVSPAGQPTLNPADTRYLLGNLDGERKVRDGAITTLGANIGLPIGAGYANLTAEYRDRNATNRAGPDLRPNYVPSNGAPAFDARELTFDRINFKVGDAKTEDFNLFANAGAPIGDFELYGFASYGKRDGLSAANYRSANAAANRDFSTISPATAPNNGNFAALTPDGFLPLIDTNLKDWAGTAGVRGEVGGWKADASLGYGHNQFFFTIRDSLNTSFGRDSQNKFDAGGLEFGQWLANLDFSRQFAVGLAGPLSVGVGVEYRDENFKITPGELQSYALGPLFRPTISNSTAANCTTQGGLLVGTNCTFPGRAAAAGSQGFPGIPPASKTDESRHSYAGYVEFDAELFRNFTATVAGRYEKFSDFGNTVNGKIALRYEFVPGLAVRGSLSNGFRAPSLHQQFFTTTSTNFIAGVPVDISTVAVGSPVARALGATDLKPEKSRNLSIGATASPLRGLSLTADYYNIRIKDRIVLTENLGPGNSALPLAQRNAIGAVLAANGFQSVGAARFFINGLDTTTRGFDVIAAYRWRGGDLGTWNLTAAYNRNKTRIDNRINELGPLATISDLILFGREQGVRFTRGQPENKIVLSADGEIRNFGLTARTTRYGEAVAVEASAPLAPNAAALDVLGPDDQVLSPKWITDLELRYKALGRIDLAIGANNVFDVYPDRRPFGPRPQGGLYPQNFQYIPYAANASPFGINGRFLYARIGVGF